MEDPRAKNSKDSIEKVSEFSLKTHSHILTSDFSWKDSKLAGYLFQVHSSCEFGVILPMRLPENPFLRYMGSLDLSPYAIDTLKLFQHELWSHLFKSSNERSGSISEANYLVVPLTGTSVDWMAIKRAVGEEPLLKVSDYILNSRKNLIMRTGYKGNATWKYLSEVNSSTTVREFFQGLLGSMHPDIDSLSERYKGYDPLDILLDEAFTNQSAAAFRVFLKSNIGKHHDKQKNSEENVELDRSTVLDESTTLIFAKQTKSIKHQPPVPPAEKKQIYPNGTPILILTLVSVFYLSVSQWSKARALYQSLLNLENFSYLLDFSKCYNYLGDFSVLSEACQSPGLDHSLNYESLETLGDTVLKVVYTLHIYLNNIELNEHELTRKRGWRVSNKTLTSIAKEHNLHFYLKTKALRLNNFRPAYYAGRNMQNETDEVQHKVSDGMLADFVEALIGAFYVAQGIKSAAEFMLKLGIFVREGWRYTASFLNDDPLGIISLKDLANFPEGAFKISELLYGSRKGSLGDTLMYQFQDKKLLSQALTHHSLDPNFNYERLEFLGDAIIDVIILTNIWKLQKFSPDFLTYFKHELVGNNTLAKICFSTGIYRYMIVDEEVKGMIEEFYKKTMWDEDIYSGNDIVMEMPKSLGDIFESMVAAVLIDSNSLSIACMVFGPFFGNLILYMVKNQKKYKKRIIARLCEMADSIGKKVEFKEFQVNEVFYVQVLLNGVLVREDFGESIKKAKDHASLAVYELLLEENKSKDGNKGSS